MNPMMKATPEGAAMTIPTQNTEAQPSTSLQKVASRESLYRSLIGVAILTATLGAGATVAATLTLRQGLDGYAGTRDDASLHNNPNVYNNLDDKLYAYSTIAGPYLGTVVGFDVSALPAGATINAASLKMTIHQDVSPWGNGAEQTWNIKDPTAQWIEGQVSYYFAQNTGAGVLWNPTDQPFGAGGTGITMANQPTVIATGSASGLNLAGVAVSFDVTSLVADWYADAAQNRGFAVLDVSGAPAVDVYWAGKANVNETWRPTLTIDYVVPEPVTASLLLLAGGVMVGWRRRRDA